ncbi:hypothetical protein HERIO_2237 [Hepatospora eriocheir]|uniref:Uncharacterized protein n=1 Tax=Hepatospora eriocheir TaxID=1081669 RepID=A0A1X0Q7K4_9MICR|nr:hypothetical protein HERIO_2237 [Hepatospora eriocheir]
MKVYLYGMKCLSLMFQLLYKKLKDFITYFSYLLNLVLSMLHLFRFLVKCLSRNNFYTFDKIERFLTNHKNFIKKVIKLIKRLFMVVKKNKYFTMINY